MCHLINPYTLKAAVHFTCNGHCTLNKHAMASLGNPINQVKLVNKVTKASHCMCIQCTLCLTDKIHCTHLQCRCLYRCRCPMLILIDLLLKAQF